MFKTLQGLTARQISRNRAKNESADSVTFLLARTGQILPDDRIGQVILAWHRGMPVVPAAISVAEAVGPNIA
jgi:hypothetical protein